MRAAIYARYSSDNQREASIEDQIRVCRARAARDGWEVVEIYTDYAVTGATALRPGYQALLQAGRAGDFDVVLAESLDRLSRDQEHVAALYKQMSFAGVGIVTLAEGEISELHVGLKGTMSALYLKDLAQKTHRGLEGRVRAGRSAGGLSYGYRVVRGADRPGEDDPGIGGRAIDAAQAGIVRRIFADYVAGRSPRSIARALNTACMPGPRNGRWTASLLLGNAARETGILRNRLYAGELVWNRQRFIKDPVTGKRVARLNPREAWISQPVPALRIVDRALWEAAQHRLEVGRHTVLNGTSAAVADTHGLGAGATRGGRLGQVRRPSWPLSGLVRCGVCGGSMTVVGEHGRLGCANHRERDTCSNRRTVLRERLLSRVLTGLKTRLLAPEAVEKFVAEYVAAVNTSNREAAGRLASLQSQHERIGRQIGTLVRTITDAGGTRTIVEELRRLERRQDELASAIALAGAPEPVPVLHPNLAQIYRQKVERLEQALQDPDVSAAASEALRSLIDAITVYPGERRGDVQIELRGDLAAFLYLAEAAESGGARTAILQNANSRSDGVMGSLVAGRGFEPLTFRL